MITKTIKLLLVLCIVVLFTLSSCTVSNAKNYPLSVDDGSSGEVGNQLNKAGDSWAFGMLYIRNIGKTPIMINHVALADEENMIMKEAYLRDVEEGSGLIGLARWPLELSDIPITFNLDECKDAEGAVVAPGDGYNLVIIVESQEDDASASGLIIEYQDVHQKKYVQKSNYAYFLSSEGFENN